MFQPTPLDMEEMFDCEFRDPSGMRAIGSVRVRIGLEGVTLENQNGKELEQFPFNCLLSWLNTRDKGCFTFTVRTKQESQQDIKVWGPPQLIQGISNSVDSKIARLMALRREGYDISQLKSPPGPAVGAPVVTMPTPAATSYGQGGGVQAPTPIEATAPPFMPSPNASQDHAELAWRQQQQQQQQAATEERRSCAYPPGHQSHQAPAAPSPSRESKEDARHGYKSLGMNFGFTLLTNPVYALYMAGSWGLTAYKSKKQAGSYDFLAAESEQQRRKGGSMAQRNGNSSSSIWPVRARNRYQATSPGGTLAIIGLMREILHEVQEARMNGRRTTHAPRVARLVASGLAPGNADRMSYEQLLTLQEQIGFSDRGATQEQIRGLPTRTFEGGSTCSSNNDKCPICLDHYQQGQEIKTLPCLHTFHVDCVDQWLKHNMSCLLCKQNIC